MMISVEINIPTAEERDLLIKEYKKELEELRIQHQLDIDSAVERGVQIMINIIEKGIKNNPISNKITFYEVALNDISKKAHVWEWYPRAKEAIENILHSLGYTNAHIERDNNYQQKRYGKYSTVHLF